MSPRAAWRLESLGFASVYDYTGGKQDWMAHGLPTEGRAVGEPRAGTLARRDVPTCRPDEPLASVRERTRAAGWEVCVVLNEERVVLGLLRKDELGGDEERVEDAMRPGPSTFRPNVPAEELADFLRSHGMENAPITTADGRLVGMLFRDDAQRAAHERHGTGHGDG